MPARPPSPAPLPAAFLVLLVLLVLPACDKTEPDPDEPAWSLDNAEPAWGTPEDGWRLGEEPVVVAGDSAALGDASEDDPLFQVRAGGLFSDGGFALAERGANRIVIYGPDGALLQELGGEGSGPGEFRELMFLTTSTTEHAFSTWDPALQRATLFRRAAPAGMDPTDHGEADDRAWDPRVVAGPAPGADGLPVPIAFVDPHHLLVYMGPPRITATGQESLGLAVFGATEEGTFERVADLGRTLSKTCASPDGPGACLAAPFTTFQALAGRGTQVVASSPQHFAFHVYDLDASDPHAPVVHGRRLSERFVTDDAMDSLALRRAGADATDAQVSEAKGEIRALRVPDRIQGIDALHVDSEGMTWARRFGGDSWSIFTPEGRWLGDLELPRGFSLFDVSADRVLGVRRGELGVERVEVWELCRYDCWSAVASLE